MIKESTNKLLDLDTLIWYLEGNEKLPIEIRELIENESGFNYVSMTSIWELAIRVQNKEIELHFPFRVLETILFQNHFLILQPGINEFDTLSNLPGDKREIFSRILISTAINKKLILISNKDFDEIQGMKLVKWKEN
ncbi:MAG: PIN domain-containing protein [Bacteroidia bacterium]